MQLLNAASRQGHKGAKQALIDIRNLDKGHQSANPGKVSSAPALRAPAQPTDTSEKNSTPVVLNDRLIDKQPAEPAQTKIAPSSDPERTEWLLTQDSEHYTIQLIATQSKLGAIQYLKKLPKNINPFIYRFTKKGNAWYAVSAGIHTDYNRAKKSIKTFPAKIRKTKPWVRNIGQLKILIQGQ